MSSEGTANVLDVRMEAFMNKEDWSAEYVSSLWVNWTTSPEWYDRVSQTREVREYLYATTTAETSNSVNPWSHKTHRPKLTQIADTLKSQYLAAVLPHDDTIQFRAGDSEADTEETKREVEAYIRSRHRLYGLDKVVASLLDDFVEDGNAFSEEIYQSKVAQTDPSGAVLRGYVGPRIRRIEPHRIAFNTQAASFEESPKIVQSVKTLGDIASEIEDESLPPEYREALAQALEFRSYMRGNVEAFPQTWLESPVQGWVNNHVYWSGELVEVLTFYGSFYNTKDGTLHRNRKMAIVDRKMMVLDEPIDTYDGNPLIRHAVWRKRPHSLLGMGPLANLTGMQYYLNHLENAKADALDKMITQDRVLRGIDDVKRNPDGSVDYFVHENGDVKNLAPDTTILQADFKIAEIEAKMEEYAGAPREAAGIRSPGEKTKFEVAELRNNSARMFQAKIMDFEKQLLVPAVNDELELAARHLDGNLEVLVSEEEEEVYKAINADVLKRKGSLIATGAQHFALQAQYAQELQQFMNMLQLDPSMAVHFPAQNLAEAWNAVLSGGRRDGLMQKFGRLYEEAELEEVQMALSEVMAQKASVSPVTADGLAPEAPIAPEGQQQPAPTPPAI